MPLLLQAAGLGSTTLSDVALEYIRKAVEPITPPGVSLMSRKDKIISWSKTSEVERCPRSTRVKGVLWSEQLGLWGRRVGGGMSTMNVGRGLSSKGQ